MISKEVEESLSNSFSEITFRGRILDDSNQFTFGSFDEIITRADSVTGETQSQALESSMSLIEEESSIFGIAVPEMRTQSSECLSNTQPPGRRFDALRRVIQANVEARLAIEKRVAESKRCLCFD
jgi:hypothetical protein